MSNMGSLPKVNLVGGFNPIEKYARQIGSFPQIGMKIKKMKPPPSNLTNAALTKHPSQSM